MTKLLPNLNDTELIANRRHSPPTTDEFRAWLSGRRSRFLLDEQRNQRGVGAAYGQRAETYLSVVPVNTTAEGKEMLGSM